LASFRLFRAQLAAEILQAFFQLLPFGLFLAKGGFRGTGCFLGVLERGLKFRAAAA
jgi:hypothetical protein